MCVANAQSIQRQCNSIMRTDIGNYCTNTLSALSASDIGIADLQNWADAVCARNEYFVDPLSGIVSAATPACRNSIAAAKTANERANCTEDLMNGSGPYYDSMQIKVDVNGIGFTIGNGGGGVSSGLTSGGYGACFSREQILQRNCDQAQQCARSKCDGQTTGCGPINPGGNR
jgi:hypothetical protein